MTPQEALEMMKTNLKLFPHAHLALNGTWATCIFALEKQVPEKPIPTDEQNIRYSMNYICPACGKHFSGTGIAGYCYHCGQALDWSDTY